MSTLPTEKIFSNYPPQILETTNGRFLIFEIAGEWYEVDDKFTIDDAMNLWEQTAPEVVTPKVEDSDNKNAQPRKIAIGRWETASDSVKGKLYEVIKYDDQSYSCNCQSYIFHKKEDGERTCKHIKKIIATESKKTNGA